MLDVSAGLVDKAATAAGKVIVPFPIASGESVRTESVEVDISLPVGWKEGGKVVVYASYEFDDNELIMPQPTETYGTGMHTLSLYYPISGVSSEKMHTFKVYLWMSGGRASIAEGGCIASISGQSMAAATKNWDGTLNFEDTIPTAGIKLLTCMNPLHEQVTFTNPPDRTINYQEPFTKIKLGFMDMELVE